MEEKKTADKKALKEKKRQRLILIRKIKVGTVLCAVLALVLYLLSAFVFFRIDKIEVIGVKDSEGNILPASTYYTEEEIIRVSGVETGDSLVRVSKSAVRDSIEKLLPYIGNVKVQRRYPSTLRLVTEDTHAVYGADAGGGLTLLDENYKVLGVSEKRPKGCMKITGLSFESAETGETAVFTDEAYKARIKSIVDACNDAGIENITKLDLSNIANVRIVINSRVTMILGTITDLNEKLSMGLRTMEAELQNASEAKIIIDVTDSERSYVRDDFSPVEDDEEVSEPEEPADISPEDDAPEENPEEPAQDNNDEKQPEAVG
ncbi:MAG: FtsQ-type POTRA domain-containing protein [Clostridia bacterium]|nr:FtsQ-type POTRA domain-containing protein [Clostridia bacterium]